MLFAKGIRRRFDRNKSIKNNIKQNQRSVTKRRTLGTHSIKKNNFKNGERK
jgi:hypothetical protein